MKSRITKNIVLYLILLVMLLPIAATATGRTVTVAGLPDNTTLRMRASPVDGDTIGRTWNGSEFGVLDTYYDDQGREWLFVGAWVAGWYTEEETVSDSQYLTANLPHDTTWAVLLTDNVDGEPVPRMNQEGWTWGNQNPSPTYPCTVVLRNSNGTKPPAVAISDEIMEWTIGLQVNDNAVDILLNPGSGWINKTYPEQILTCGAWVIVLEKENNAIRVDTLPWDWTSEPDVNHQTAHPYVNHFIAVHTYGYYVDISSGGNGTAESIFTPVLKRDNEAWIFLEDSWAEERYWFPPDVPFEVTVTSASGLTIRSEPVVSSDTVISTIPYGEIVTILAYYPSDNGVWGLTNDGWISLQYLSYPGDRSPWYGTTWTMPAHAVPAPRPTYEY